jgi:hypothetical protein
MSTPTPSPEPDSAEQVQSLLEKVAADPSQYTIKWKRFPSRATQCVTALVDGTELDIHLHVGTDTASGRGFGFGSAQFDDDDSSRVNITTSLENRQKLADAIGRKFASELSAAKQALDASDRTLGSWRRGADEGKSQEKGGGKPGSGSTSSSSSSSSTSTSSSTKS